MKVQHIIYLYLFISAGPIPFCGILRILFRNQCDFTVFSIIFDKRSKLSNFLIYCIQRFISSFEYIFCLVFSYLVLCFRWLLPLRDTCKVDCRVHVLRARQWVRFPIPINTDQFSIFTSNESPTEYTIPRMRWV